MIKCKVIVPFKVKDGTYIYLDNDRANELKESGFIRIEEKKIETATVEKKSKNGK